MFTPRSVSRREMMALSASGLATAAGVPWFHRIANAAAAAPNAKKKACILLWMDGGPSQAHTFDPKPGGEYPDIATAVPGIRVTDCLPKMAGVMKDVALLRGMTTGEGDHYRAKYLMHTGYSRIGGFEHPAIGCIASAEAGTAGGELPNFITIDAGFDKGNGGRLYRSVPSYLGVQHTPLAVSDPNKGLENLGAINPEFDEELELLRSAEKRFAKEYDATPVRARQDAFDRAVRLMRSDKARAFDVDQESARTRDAYVAAHKFGRACLMARRLVEAGATFIEIFHRGWDDHEGAGKRVRTRCEWMDPSMTALITDLKERGLLDTTLVVWMGEFGRSPVNGNGHHARAWTTLLTGGGVKGGQVIGKTDEKGKNPGGTVAERPITAPDFFATICKTLDIEWDKEVTAPGDRPIRLVDKIGKPVEEVLG